MIASSAADDSAGPFAAGACAAATRPALGPRRRRSSLQQLDDQRLDPAEDMAEAERHRGRKEQADRPEDEQRQAAGAAGDEPAVAHLLPAFDAAARVQRSADGDAERGAEDVEDEVDVRGDALRQVVLQHLHDEREQRADADRDRRRRARAPAAADQGDEQQEAERQVAEQVGDEIEGRPPAPPAEPQEVERAGSRNAPAGERIEAGVDDEPDIQPRQRHGRAAVARHPRKVSRRPGRRSA